MVSGPNLASTSAHMAAMMSSVNPFTPVTPPPESLTFPKPPVPRPFQNSLKRKASNMSESLNGSSILPPPPAPTSQPQTASSPAPSSSHGDSKSPPPPNVPGANLDPKYLAMVSRIAAYYQQRCQAVANYQQQRCQAWANMHRQRCQDMMQASMLVVAWYVRDRIQRRRRREKRRFKSGLRRRTDQPKAAKAEVVRRWVKQIPESPESPNTNLSRMLVDPEESEFSMDKEPQPDKDSKLFDMADNLIKSQYKKIEVPIMGVLNFDESDNDSESEPEEPEEFDQFDEMDEDDEDIEGDEEYYEVEDDELYDDDMEYEGDDGSEVVHRGTGTGSGSRGNDRSESS